MALKGEHCPTIGVTFDFPVWQKTQKLDLSPTYLSSGLYRAGSDR